jgi:hypothetical protein
MLLVGGLVTDGRVRATAFVLVAVWLLLGPVVVSLGHAHEADRLLHHLTFAAVFVVASLFFRHSPLIQQLSVCGLHTSNPLRLWFEIRVVDALQKNWKTPTLSESSIVLIGLLLAIVGLAFRDTVGVTSLLVAVGIGLMIAGTVYLAVEGREVLRLSLAFIALLALPLFAYSGIVQWIGGFMTGTVVVGVLYSRVSWETIRTRV